MQKVKMFWDYWHHYEWFSGSSSIRFWRTVKGETVYHSYLEFNTPQEAEAYFTTECGA